jgi:hypothetical protein
MTWEFLFFANLTLLLRLRLLLSDAPAGPRGWWTKCVAESSAVALILVPGLGAACAIATSVIATFASSRWDRRVRDRNAVHLAIGLGQIVALSFCLSAVMAVQVRPTVVVAFEMLREASALGPVLVSVLGAEGLKIFLGLLLVGNEVNLFIRFVLGRLQLKPGGTGTIDANEYARGRVIGLLERMLIYLFVLNGQYGAVGFTLAAKGFTRFKELDNRSFAEYVLIGTLLSSGLAMATAIAVLALP